MAHWPRFWNATVAYIRQHYSFPFPPQVHGLIAFLFGMVAHGVSDSSWHSLMAPNGLIEVSKWVDFQGSFGQAHTNADLGGELLLSHLSDMKFIHSSWKVPSQHLVHIYELMNHTVTVEQIDQCMLRGYVATQALRYVGPLAFPSIAYKSPFLIDFYKSYFRGGLMDMSAWIVHCWYYLERWLVQGTLGSHFCKDVDAAWNEQDEILYSTQWIKRHEEQTKNTTPSHFTPWKLSKFSTWKDMRHWTLLSNQKRSIEWTNNILLNEDHDEIHHQWWSRIHWESLDWIFAFILDMKTRIRNLLGYDACSVKLPDVQFHVRQPYSGLGKSISWGNFGKGTKQLVVSAPFYPIFNQSQSLLYTGAVFILKSNLKSGYIEEEADQVLYSDSFGSEFGSSLAVIDINKDGIDDLAVSAPSFKSLNLEYTGRVYIFLGKNNSGLSLQPDIIIEPFLEQPHHYPLLKWPQIFTRFGENMKSLDLNDDGFKDLLVSSPFSDIMENRKQLGQVHAFFSRSNPSFGLWRMNESDWSLSGSQNYEWFGSSAIFFKNSSGKSHLIIGASGYRETVNDKMQGKLYGYEIGKRRIPKLKYTLSSPLDYGQFAKTTSPIYVNNQSFLAISSPSETANNPIPLAILFPGALIPSNMTGFQAGVVRLFAIKNLLGNLSMNSSDVVFTEILGNHTNGHFGSSVAFSSTTQSLFISEPHSMQERGRVYEYTLFLKSNSLSFSKSRCFQGWTSKQQFGTKVLLVDLDENGHDDLIVTSINGESEDSGSISIYYNS